jgi:hypothetical protein
MKSGLFSLTLFALSFAQAYDMQPFINEQMQRAQVKSQAQEIQGQSLAKPSAVTNIDVQTNSSSVIPVSSQDSSIRNLEAIQPKEQSGADLEQPQAGFRKAIDPAIKYQEDLAEKDKLVKERRNYRNAVQREFVRKAAEAGIEVDRNVAKEIEALELKVTH